MQSQATKRRGFILTKALNSVFNKDLNMKWYLISKKSGVKSEGPIKTTAVTH
jgi:hypothetical protein